MRDIQYNLQFNKLGNALQLGEIVGSPKAVLGGYLHRMYAVDTQLGKYAVKALNPQIMLRPDVMQRYIESEKIAETAAKFIPALPARKWNGTPLINIDNQYYLLFDWIAGQSLKPNEINSAHCEKIGSILADIHMTDFTKLDIPNGMTEIPKQIEWSYYLQKGQELKAVWVKQLSENIDRLSYWNSLANTSSELLASNMVISHRDLDPKNVMWDYEQPTIIDWEAAGYINPMHDLIETAVYWSETHDGNIDKERFIACIDGYKKKFGALHADWESVLANGFLGKLGWLEYNLKRSLCIECTDQEEQQLGTIQVKETISNIIQYANMIPKITAWLREV